MIRVLDDVCALLAPPWSLDERAAELAVRVALLYEQEGYRTYLISGHRSCAKQQELVELGATDVPPGFSVHQTIPSRAFDLDWDRDPDAQTHGRAALIAKCEGYEHGFLYGIPDPGHFEEVFPPGSHFGCN